VADLLRVASEARSCRGPHISEFAGLSRCAWRLITGRVSIRSAHHAKRRFYSPAFWAGLPLLVALAVSGCSKKESKQQQELTVEVTEVQQQNVPLTYSWVGTTEGFQNAEIKAKVQGYLLSRNYEEGSFVKKGTVLFQIDPRPFQAELAQAQAQLAQATANADLARTTLTRQTELFQKQVISQQEFDTSTQKARADLASEQAAAANVQSAQLNLDYCTITAPLDGIVGKAEAQIGDLVGPSGTSSLTTMSQVQPMLVYFSISEQDYLQSEDLIKQVSSTPMEQRVPAMTLTLSDGSTYEHNGKFDFANRQVNEETGSILMAGIFPNPDLFLRPGQYAKVSAITRIAKDALLVPQRAVMNQQGINQVAVVGDDNKVQIVSVTIAEPIASDYIISEGLKAGQKVVTEGIQKVKDGMTVKTEPAKDTSARPVPTVPPYLNKYVNQMSSNRSPDSSGGDSSSETATPTPTATPAESPTATPEATSTPAAASPTPAATATP